MFSIVALTGLASLLSAAPAPPSCRGAFAPAEAGQIAFQDCGDPAMPPILIVPGGPGLDASYMLPLADMIARLHHRVLLVEPRGTGASRAAIGDGSHLTVEGSISDIEAVRRAAGVEKAVLLGHSFGGSVAQAYAAAFPDRVQSLILMDSAGSGVPAPRPLDGWRKRGTPEELARYDELRAKGDRIGAMRIKFELSFFHRSIGRRFVASLHDENIHADVMPLSAHYEHDFHLKPMTRTALPVTLVTGQIDWIRGYEPALRATYPNLRLLVVPKAGHFPWEDAPDRTRQALAQALAN